MELRLDKIISSAGVASRSEVKTLIRRGAVQVDGVTAKSPQEKVDPDRSVITVNGEPVNYKKNRCYMMNKPAGYVTSTEDPRDRTVMELLPDDLRRLGLFPAGRLDKDSEGLLIITDDGELAHRITSPKHKVKKRYYIETDGEFTLEDIEAFSAGIVLGDGYECLPAKLELLTGGVKYSACVTVSEGKYHQVKRMAAARGKHVTYLKRLSTGALKLPDDLGPGKIKELSAEDIESLFVEK